MFGAGRVKLMKPSETAPAGRNLPISGRLVRIVPSAARFPARRGEASVRSGGASRRRGGSCFFYRKTIARAARNAYGTAVGDGRAGRREKRKKKIIIYRIAIDN
jgi:hypothetical protein